MRTFLPLDVQHFGLKTGSCTSSSVIAATILHSFGIKSLICPFEASLFVSQLHLKQMWRFKSTSSEIPLKHLSHNCVTAMRSSWSPGATPHPIPVAREPWASWSWPGSWTKLCCLRYKNTEHSLCVHILHNTRLTSKDSSRPSGQLPRVAGCGLRS